MSAFQLSGKNILVTAAGAGIGKAIAEEFAMAGAGVLATDIDQSALKGVSGPGLETASLDATSEKDIATLVSKRGPFDVLVNCVGIVPHGTILDCEPAEWNKAFQVNIDSMFLTMRAVLPGMLERGKGSIINIASVVSSLKGFPNRAAYGASKAAVIGLTKSVATDFVTANIRCNAICPGTVQSPSLEQRIAELGKTTGVEAARNAFVARQPMGRFGKPEEIAAAALYLASDESAYTTGQAFIIDGGILA